MPRQVRIEYPGAVYHVMSRGNHGDRIYRSEEDRELFLETLGEACEQTGWQIHAYVLMGNHYHALIETPEPNLVVGMKWFLGTYTQRFNSRHRVFGHLFQSRYKALVVDGSEEDYFQVVSTYIALKPARARLIRIGEQRLKEYRWSSYPEYLRRPSQRPPWLRVDRVLGSLGIHRDDAKGRRGYEAYVEGRVLELKEKRGREIRRGWYLGEDSFRGYLEDWVEKSMKGKERGTYSGGAKRRHDEATAEQLLKGSLRRLGMREEQLGSMPKGAEEKQVLAWWLRKQTVVSRRWISRQLGMGHESRVTQSVGRVKRARDRRTVQLKTRLETQDS